MNLLDNKKAKIFLAICIFVLSLLELCWGVQVSREYRGSYCVAIFIPFIAQPYWYYKLLFRKQQNYYKIRIVAIVLISIILPLTIYYTIPNYTYNDGKCFIEQHMNLDREVVFIDYSYSESTIPVLNGKKTLLGSNREYYYGIKLGKKNKYFIVNAVSGKVTQLAEEYWDESSEVSKDTINL